MKQHRILALLLSILLLTALLTGCAASSKNMAADTAPSEAQNWKTESAAAAEEWGYDTPAEAPAEAAEPETEWADAADTSFTTSAAGNAELEVGDNSSLSDYAAKIIYSANISAETTQFDEAVARIEAMVASYQGFVESSNVYGNTRYNDDGTTTVVDRHASYALRIPADKFEQFMSETSSIGNVLSSNRYAENVTSTYTDYEARLSSLRTQEERLLAMLEKTEDVESLVALEERLADVRYETESIERNLRNMDMQIRYSTVSIDLDEVEIYTPTVTVQRTFGEKFADAFSDGWRSFGRSFQRFILNLTEALPSLILLAVIIIVVVVIVRRCVKKSRAKKAAKQAEAPQDEQK